MAPTRSGGTRGKATQIIVSRPTNSIGSGGNSPGRSRVGKSYGKIGKLRGSENPGGLSDTGVRVRAKSRSTIGKRR